MKSRAFLYLLELYEVVILFLLLDRISLKRFFLIKWIIPYKLIIVANFFNESIFLQSKSLKEKKIEEGKKSNYYTNHVKNVKRFLSFSRDLLEDSL
jgi:hypothetical protein